jgi:hypothetical protein
MAKQVQYFAKRSLVSSSPVHVVDTKYTLALTVSAIDRTAKFSRVITETLSGTVYSTQRSYKQQWRITLVPATAAETENLREFLDSTMGGVVFDLDLDDSDGYRQVVMVGKSYTEKRAVKQGDGGGSDRFIFGFTCRER